MMKDAARRLAAISNTEAVPHHREAPNNIEAEQALLGAMLINNDAFYRVSDFLKPLHFHEPLHRRIFEVMGDIIRMGKIAHTVTVKTFLPADDKVGDMTVAQYLARLAADAVSIINAEDYGRAIYDLALRRSLITIGEDMVNIAYDAPLDMPPQTQIEDTERRLFELAETGRYDGGFEAFTDAVKTAVDMANAAYMRDGHLSGISTGMRDLDARLGGLQQSDLVVLAGRPGMGKTALATNIAYNIARAYQSVVARHPRQPAKVSLQRVGIAGLGEPHRHRHATAQSQNVGIARMRGLLARLRFPERFAGLERHLARRHAGVADIALGPFGEFASAALPLPPDVDGFQDPCEASCAAQLSTTAAISATGISGNVFPWSGEKQMT
eukprot:gene40184-54335_t